MSEQAVNKEQATQQQQNGAKTVITLQNISKTFTVRDKTTNTIRDSFIGLFQKNKRRDIKALDSISLDVKKGEIFGVIGRNGSGKSTLMNIMLGAYQADEGGVREVEGRMIRLALGMGFDKQLTGKENIYINGSVLGLTFKEIDEKFDEIIDFAELRKFVNTKVKFYSKGMKSRLMFAIALHTRADVFLFDEFFGGVGDEIFKEKSEKVFEDSFTNNKTIVLISHNLGSVRKHCDRVLLLDEGKMVALGTPNEVLPVYKNLSNKRLGKNNQIQTFQDERDEQIAKNVNKPNQNRPNQQNQNKGNNQNRPNQQNQNKGNNQNQNKPNQQNQNKGNQNQNKGNNQNQNKPNNNQQNQNPNNGNQQNPNNGNNKNNNNQS